MAASSAENEREEEETWRELVQLHDGESLFSPISNSTRIKFTCIAVSPTHVTLGANSGGVYCFNGQNHQLTRLLANREGSISLLSFSPDNALLAVVAGGHNVCFWEHNLHDPNSEAKRFHVSSILKDSVVTDMVWDKRGTRLFYGDEQGRIVIAFIPRFTRKFGGGSLFKRVDEIIHFEKVPIFQLDIWNDLLLVSSKERCFILKLQGESIESLIQVGKRAIRNGFYGACFYPRTGQGGGQPPIVYSARPKGRLWAASVAGEVISTVRTLDFTPPKSSTIINLHSSSLPLTAPTNSAPSLSSCRHGLLNQHYLITWHSGVILVQVFEGSSYLVKTWTRDYNDINDVAFTGDKMYILYNNCQSVSCLSYLTLNEILTQLMGLKNYSLTKQILVEYKSLVREQVSVDLLMSVIQQLMEHEQSLPPEIQDLVSLVKSNEEKELKGDEEEEERDEDSKDSSKSEENTIQADAVVETINETEKLNLEDINLFPMEGEGEELPPGNHRFLPPQEEGPLPFSDEESLPVKRSKSSPHSFPSTVSHATDYKEDPIAHSLTDHTHHQDSPDSAQRQSAVTSPPIPVSSLPASNVSPTDALPVVTRMASVVPNDDDLVVVRKRKGSASKKKRRGSADSATIKRASSMYSQMSLEDILEGQVSNIVSPSHSQLSSTVASADSSPHASLPSSPPLPPPPPSFIKPATTQPTVSTEETYDETDGRASPAPPPPPPPRSTRSQSWESQLESDLLLPTKMILSKVKSMATGQDGGIQRKVKGLLLSSISPTPVASTASTAGSNVGVALPDVRVVSPQTSSGMTSPEVGVAFDSSDSQSPGHLSPPVSSPPPPPPMVDDNTERFIATIHGTMQSLSSPLIICSLENMKKVLKKWLDELRLYHTHLASLGIAWKDSFSHSHLLLPVKGLVIELLVLCLEMEIYLLSGGSEEPTSNGSQNASFKALDDVVSEEIAQGSEDNASKGSEAVATPGSEVLEKSTDDLLPPADSVSGVTPEGSENITKGSDAESSSKGSSDDRSLAGFIIKYCKNVLSFEDIKHHLNRKDLKTACGIWKTLSEEDEGGAPVINESLATDAGSVSLTPPLMLELYRKDRERLASHTLSQFPNIKLWEMVALCGLEYEGGGGGTFTNGDTDTFCKYLDALCDKYSARRDFSAHFENPDLLVLSISAALLTPPTEEVKDDQGNPLRHSHLVSWPHETSLTGLTGIACSSAGVGVSDVIANMFKKKGYWKGYLQICVKRKMKERLLDTTAHLRSSSLLHQLTTNGHPFKSTTVWKMFTTLLVKPAIPVFPLSPDDLSWESVVREMVRMIGAEEGAKVLESLDDIQCGLPCQIHELFVKISAVHREQRTIGHSLLENLDRYLWSKRPLFLGPHVATMYQRDETTNQRKDQNVEGKEEEGGMRTEMLRDIMSPPPLPHPLISPMTMEDSASHWGIRTSTSRCAMCGHSLMHRMSEKEQGGIGFQCGHAYHKQCLPEQACLLCFTEKYREHLNDRKR